MNKVILVGRLTRDPETRQAGDTTVTRFSLAVDRRFRKAGDETSPSADFPSCVAFGKTAEFIEKYIKQGVKIALEGRIQTGNYTDKDGVKHYTTDVIAEAVEFAESKRTDAGETPPPTTNEWLEIPEGIENDLPFK
jgi:single-strand DNA-binding protein